MVWVQALVQSPKCFFNTLFFKLCNNHLCYKGLERCCRNNTVQVNDTIYAKILDTVETKNKTKQNKTKQKTYKKNTKTKTQQKQNKINR